MRRIQPVVIHGVAWPDATTTYDGSADWRSLE